MHRIGGPGGPWPLPFSAEQKIICGTKTKFFDNGSRIAFS